MWSVSLKMAFDRYTSSLRGGDEQFNLDFYNLEDKLLSSGGDRSVVWNVYQNYNLNIKDLAYPKYIAIKAFVKNDDTLWEEEQIQEILKLNHPNVVKYWALDVHNFAVLHYVEHWPTDLANLVKGRPGLGHQPEVVSRIWRQLAEGLNYLHAHNLAHKNIKPHNVLCNRVSLLGEDSINIRVAFSDFNMVRNTTDMTVGMQDTETVLYSEPVRDKSSLEDWMRADIYSMGLLMRYVLTGLGPEEDNTSIQMEAKLVCLRPLIDPEALQRPKADQALVMIKKMTLETDTHDQILEILKHAREYCRPIELQFETDELSQIVKAFISLSFGKNRAKIRDMMRLLQDIKARIERRAQMAAQLAAHWQAHVGLHIG